MPAPPLSGLVECEKETAQLSGVWNVIEEWITAYDGWKDGKFKDIDVEELENASQIVGKKIQKLGREVKHWSAWQGCCPRCYRLHLGGYREHSCPARLRRSWHVRSKWGTHVTELDAGTWRMHLLCTHPLVAALPSAASSTAMAARMQHTSVVIISTST